MNQLKHIPMVTLNHYNHGEENYFTRCRCGNPLGSRAFAFTESTQATKFEIPTNPVKSLPEKSESVFPPTLKQTNIMFENSIKSETCNKDKVHITKAIIDDYIAKYKSKSPVSSDDDSSSSLPDLIPGLKLDDDSIPSTSISEYSTFGNSVLETDPQHPRYCNECGFVVFTTFTVDSPVFITKNVDDLCTQTANTRAGTASSQTTSNNKEEPAKASSPAKTATSSYDAMRQRIEAKKRKQILPAHKSKHKNQPNGS
jgi:hypothetical protein